MTQDEAENAPGSDIDVAATADLLGRIRGGDAAARDELFLRFEKPLLRFLHGRLPPAAAGVLATEDAAQEICAKVFRSLDRFEHRGVGAFWAYLRGSAQNYLRDLSRTPGKMRQAETWVGDSRSQPAAASLGPMDKLVKSEDLAAFEKGLLTLDERTRNALLLRFELDVEYAEIASECGYASADAARMAVTRAITKVAEEMARDKRE